MSVPSQASRVFLFYSLGDEKQEKERHTIQSGFCTWLRASKRPPLATSNAFMILFSYRLANAVFFVLFILVSLCWYNIEILLIKH